MYREQDITNYTLVTTQQGFFIFIGLILLHGAEDFDVDGKSEGEERTPEDYRVAYNSVLKETLWMTSLQMVSNLLLLVPLLVTGEKK